MIPDAVSDLWLFTHEYRITRLEGTTDALTNEMVDRHGSFQADLGRMEERMDRITILCRAMHELLKESGLYDNAKLRDKVLEIDMRDGRKDGKFTPLPKQCPKCDAMICRKFNRCLFCGHEDREGSPFHHAE